MMKNVHMFSVSCCSRSGPSHMSLLVLPVDGAFLMSRALGDGTRLYDPIGVDFIDYSHGLDAPAWNFWFEIEVNLS